MESGVIDLRRVSAPVLLVTAPLLWVLAVGTLVVVARDEVSGGPGERVVAGVLGGCIGLLALGASLVLFDLRRPRRLLIDHEGIRLDRGPRRPVFRLAWTELAGVGVRIDDRARRRDARHYRRFRELPPGATPILVALELVPLDAEAVRRHPELRREWRLGRERSWVIPLTGAPGAAPPVGALVQRWRPQLWRGERSGALLAE